MRSYRQEITTIGQHSADYLNVYVQEAIHKISMNHNICKIGDIGCGIGLHSKMLKNKFDHIHFTGIDFSKATIDYLSQNKIFDEIILASSSKLPITDKYFDIVISMENLEHLYYEDVLEALYELKRTSKFIIITTPIPELVVNTRWIIGEITEATEDMIPLTEHDYSCLESCVHKSILNPRSLLEAGFKQEKYTEQKVNVIMQILIRLI